MASETVGPKVALITGVTGQDGAYLSRLLLEKGYVVHGVQGGDKTSHGNASGLLSVAA